MPHRALPHGIEAVILRCLEKQPDRRYQSIEELRHAIAMCAGAGSERRLPPLRRSSRRRLALALAIGIAVAAGAVTAALVVTKRPPPLFVQVTARESTPLGAQLRAAVEGALAKHPTVSLGTPPAGTHSFTVVVTSEEPRNAPTTAGEGPVDHHEDAPGPDVDMRVSFRVEATGAGTHLGTATLDVRKPSTPFSSESERAAAIAAAVANTDVARFLDETVIAHRIMKSGDLAECLADKSAQIAVEVGADGRVERASATPSGGDLSAEAKACFDAAARSWRFHRPLHALNVTFTRTIEK
jgi:hypothetical protein